MNSEDFSRIQGCVFEFCDHLKFHPTSNQKRVLGAVLAGVKQIDCGGDRELAEILILWRLMRRKSSQVHMVGRTMRDQMNVMAELRELAESSFLKDAITWTRSRGLVRDFPNWGIYSTSRPGMKGQLCGLMSPVITLVDWGAGLDADESAFLAHAGGGFDRLVIYVGA